LLTQKLSIVIAFLIIASSISLIVIYDSNIPELVKNEQEYQQNLKEQNRELTLIEQIQKLDKFKEKCIDVRANPNSYYPEAVDACR